MTALAHDRAGPTGTTPLLLLHAGIADRRMWDPIWPRLTAERDVIRVDLRGFGESTTRPTDRWSPRADVLETLDALGVDRVHAVGCSFGAGVAVEVTLERPAAVASLFLASPGGALITERTDQLAAFWEAEGTALEAGDLDAAAEANVVAWVDGPARGPDVVDADVRDAVREMQRLAFGIGLDWDDAIFEELEVGLDPEAPERYGEIVAPTLVLTGDLDLDAIRLASDALLTGVPDVRAVRWCDTAHVPSMERPSGFADLLLDWVGSQEAGADVSGG
jgi:3-oxoadipate enol-lactonase